MLYPNRQRFQPHSLTSPDHEHASSKKKEKGPGSVTVTNVDTKRSVVAEMWTNVPKPTRKKNKLISAAHEKESDARWAVYLVKQWAENVLKHKELEEHNNKLYISELLRG